MHTNASGHCIGCQAVRTSYYIDSDKHTSAREEIEISSPNLSERGSLRSPIWNLIFCTLNEEYWKKSM